VPAIRQSQIFRASAVVGDNQNSKMSQQLQSQLPQQLSRGGDNHEVSSKKGTAASNQRAVMRAQEAQKKEIESKQRRMDGLLNLHEQNM